MREELAGKRCDAVPRHLGVLLPTAPPPPFCSIFDSRIAQRKGTVAQQVATS
jgi:hypothetical protein